MRWDGDPTPRWNEPDPAAYRGLAAALDIAVRLHVRVEVLHGDRLPSAGPVVVVANHPSYLESVVLSAVLLRLGRRPRILTARDVFDHPVARPVVRVGRMIPVHRGGGPERMVADACAALEAGELVVVYPEGHLTPPSRQSLPHPGAGLLALRTSAPVIPVATVGLEPRGGRPALRRGAVVAFGRPVTLSASGHPGDRGTQLAAAESVFRTVRELLPVAEQKLQRRARALQTT